MVQQQFKQYGSSDHLRNRFHIDLLHLIRLSFLKLSLTFLGSIARPFFKCKIYMERVNFILTGKDGEV